MHNNKKYPKDTLNNTRNESSEKIKSDILSKYLTGNRITNNKIVDLWEIKVKVKL